MKRLILFVLCSIITPILYAQQKAITDTGDEVVLYEDGTWKYVNEEELTVKEIPTNPTEFTRSKKSTFLLKSKRLHVGFWLDPKKWSFKKATDNEDAEFEFQLKDGDLYGMVISEKIEIPLETLKSIALENGQAAAPDLQIVKEEYRSVNGMKVLMLQMDGTMQGINFSFFGYYYSNENGTIQFVTYTSQNLLQEYKKVTEELLNGFVEMI